MCKTGRDPLKIQIIGFSGSGKSTLAEVLSNHHNIPLLHLDTVHFYADWQIRSLEEKNHIVETFLQEHNEWVIDGNYRNVGPERFKQSDITIYLDFNRVTCYLRCLKRYFKYRNQRRSSLGCIEKFDFEFQKWILFTGRTKEKRTQLLTLLQQTKGFAYHFKNQRQVDMFLTDYLKKPSST